jgi:hypothetical protein
MKVLCLLDKPVSPEWSLSSTPRTACELLLKAVYVQVTSPDQMGTSDSKQGHGTLHAIYASVKKSCEVRGWDGVDLLIIGGDFQAWFRCTLEFVSNKPRRFAMLRTSL